MRINKRIMVAFVIVIAVAVVVMAFTSRLYISGIFDRYMEDYRHMLLEHWEYALESYYLQRGSWEEVDEIFLQRAKGRKAAGPLRQERTNYLGVAPGEELLLTDAEGRVVLDSAQERKGEILPADIREEGRPLFAGEEQVGILIMQPRVNRTLVPLEVQFSYSVLGAVFYGGLAALAVGALLSFLLTRQITRPLALLTNSAQRFARREFQHRVQLSGEDEIGELGRAFNLMAESIERNEKLRSSLVADVSHELRTPLTVLRGNFEALQAGKLKPTPELLSSLHDEVLRLGRLASDLEVINLAEAGKLPLNYQKVEVKDLLQRAGAVFQHEADERGLEFSIEVQENLQSWVLDEDRITQVFVNLLANAFKFTSDGGKVRLGARKKEGELILEVEDSGTGIPEKDLPFVFERFYKAGQGRDEGNGLGLSIALSFVEAHGGKIRAVNLDQGGSAFIFSLPPGKEEE